MQYEGSRDGVPPNGGSAASRRRPWRTALLLACSAGAGLAYFVSAMLLLTLRSSDAAGNGLTQVAAVLAQAALWPMLAGLLALVRPTGHLPVARALLPLTGGAAVWAAATCDAQRPWLIATPLLLPPVLALLAIARGRGRARRGEWAAAAAAAALCLVPTAAALA